MESGQIVADADKTASPDAIVELELSDVKPKNQTSSIYIASIGNECRTSVINSTVNIITDGTVYTNVRRFV